MVAESPTAHGTAGARAALLFAWKLQTAGTELREVGQTIRKFDPDAAEHRLEPGALHGANPLPMEQTACTLGYFNTLQQERYFKDLAGCATHESTSSTTSGQQRYKPPKHTLQWLRDNTATACGDMNGAQKFVTGRTALGGSVQMQHYHIHSN